MRVGIEIRCIVEQSSGGITPFLQGVFSELCQTAPEHEFHFFGTMFNCSLFQDEASNVRRHTLPLRTYWERLDTLLYETSIDVLFRSFPLSDHLRFPLRRQVCFVPDLQHEVYPGFFSAEELARRRRDFPRLIEGSGAIGTLSNHARAMIRDRYPNTADDIFLMPAGSQFALAPADGPPDDAASSEVRSLQPFFYYPANLWPHKNHPVLLEAFALFRKSSPAHAQFSLVLSGDRTGYEAIKRDHDCTGVHHLGFVLREQVAMLYQSAVALVFPSLFEGFGMPVLEAFGFDCPVVSSNAASLPELVQGAALLVDPTNPGKLAQAIARIASDDELRRTLIAKGRERFKAYSWRDAAASLRAGLERVHERSRLTVAVKEVAPLVSVVTPSFNQGRFIGRTIDSVLGQSYPRIEYRVIDGGSTDNTVEVLRGYGDRVAWVSEPDRGQTHAINKGLAQARGDIQCYLNSDDTLTPIAIATVVNLFRQHPHVDMVYGDADYIDAEDQVIRPYATADYSFERLMQDCCVCQPAAFWTAAIAREIGPFDETLNYVMDYDYWLRMGRHGALIRHIPVHLANSRLYAETKTLSARPRIYEEILTVCLRHGGYVSRSYVAGYVNLKSREKQMGLLRGILYRPAFRHRYIDYLSLHLGKSKPSRVGALREMLRRALDARGISVVHARRAVDGFSPDGYLAPVSCFASEAVKSKRKLWLGGWPLTDTGVEIRSGGKLILSKVLEARREVSLAFTACDDTVTVAFDHSMVGADGRRVAFFVTNTNLLSEREL